MKNLNTIYSDMIVQLNEFTGFKPDITIVLGSGLGDFARCLETDKVLSTNELKGYPDSTVQGHGGKIYFSRLNDKKVLLFQGRLHFYEGYPLKQCLLPVFIAHKLGAKKILLTNAAGGVNPNFKPGDLMLTTSFNSWMIKSEISELIGLTSLDAKQSMHNFPSNSFNRIILEAALEEKINLKEGVYFFTKGPSYETPSEVKMIRNFYGDAVGMSTVHEAVYAHNLGMDVSAISCITNFAAGISSEKLSHAEVTETANKVKDKFEKLLKKIIETV